METRIVTGTFNTTGGTQDVTVSGFGTPQAVIVASVANTAEGSSRGLSRSFILFDGTRTRCVSARAADSVATTVAKTRGRTDLFVENDSGTEQVRASLSLITDGVRFTYNTQLTAYKFAVILIKGMGNYRVDDFTPSSTLNGTVDVTDPGFEPDGVIIITGSDFDNSTIHDNMNSCVGFAVNDTSVEQGADFGSSENNLSTSDMLGGINDNLTQKTIVDAQGEIDSFLSSGFRYKTINDNNVILDDCYLAFTTGSGSGLKAYTIATPSSDGVASYSDVGGKVKSGMILFDTSSTINSTINGTAAHFGWVDAINVVCATAAIQGRDGQSTTENYSYFDSNELTQRASNASGQETADSPTQITGGISLDFTRTQVASRPWRSMFIIETPQTVEPTGIASAEAFGSPQVNLSATVTGIPSAEAFGTFAVAPGAATIEPTGIASAEAFGNSTVTTGNVNVPVDGIPSAEAFGSFSAQASYTVGLDGIPSAEAFGALIISTGNVNTPVDGIPSAEAFGALIITTSYTVGLDGIPSAEAFGTFAVAPGAATIEPTGIASAEAFGNFTVTRIDISEMFSLFETDLEEVFFDSECGFAEVVTITYGDSGETDSLKVIFDNEYMAANLGTNFEVQQREPMAILQTRKLRRKLIRGDYCTIRGVTYSVTTSEPDGTGVSELTFHHKV